MENPLNSKCQSHDREIFVGATELVGCMTIGKLVTNYNFRTKVLTNKGNF
jgi:hypothetical protein